MSTSSILSTLLYCVDAERKTEHSKTPSVPVSKLLFVTENTRSAAADVDVVVYANFNSTMRFEYTWHFTRKWYSFTRSYFIVVTCILVFLTSEGCAEIAPHLKYFKICRNM